MEENKQNPKRKMCAGCPWHKNYHAKDGWEKNIMGAVERGDIPNPLHPCHELEGDIFKTNDSNVCIGSIQRNKEFENDI